MSYNLKKLSLADFQDFFEHSHNTDVFTLPIERYFKGIDLSVMRPYLLMEFADGQKDKFVLYSNSFDDCVIISRKVTKNMQKIAGIAKCQISFENGSDIVTSDIFEIDVKASVHDKTEDENPYIPSVFSDLRQSIEEQIEKESKDVDKLTQALNEQAEKEAADVENLENKIDDLDDEVNQIKSEINFENGGKIGSENAKIVFEADGKVSLRSGDNENVASWQTNDKTFRIGDLNSAAVDTFYVKAQKKASIRSDKLFLGVLGDEPDENAYSGNRIDISDDTISIEGGERNVYSDDADGHFGMVELKNLKWADGASRIKNVLYHNKDGEQASSGINIYNEDLDNSDKGTKVVIFANNTGNTKNAEIKIDNSAYYNSGDESRVSMSAQNIDISAGDHNLIGDENGFSVDDTTLGKELKDDDSMIIVRDGDRMSLKFGHIKDNDYYSKIELLSDYFDQFRWGAKKGEYGRIHAVTRDENGNKVGELSLGSRNFPTATYLQSYDENGDATKLCLQGYKKEVIIRFDAEDAEPHGDEEGWYEYYPFPSYRFGDGWCQIGSKQIVYKDGYTPLTGSFNEVEYAHGVSTVSLSSNHASGSTIIPISATKITGSATGFSNEDFYIYYRGTIEDWNKVEKLASINARNGVIRVFCLDGETTYEKNN